MDPTTMLVSGNLVRDPRVNTTKDGVTVTSLRIASTPRRYDREAGQWRDGTPIFVNVTCWRQLARNVHASLRKGDPVFAYGRVVQHEWERDGARHSEMEVEASVVGPDVSRALVEVMRPRRQHGPDGSGTDVSGVPGSDQPVVPAQEVAEVEDAAATEADDVPAARSAPAA